MSGTFYSLKINFWWTGDITGYIYICYLSVPHFPHPSCSSTELHAVVKVQFSLISRQGVHCIPNCCSLLWRIFNEAYMPHGLKVVRAQAERGLRGLMDLERRWRQHFLTTMRPRHLPPLWSVDHNHSKFLRKYGADLPIKLNWLSDHKKTGTGNWIFSSAGQSAGWNLQSLGQFYKPNCFFFF